MHQRSRLHPSLCAAFVLLLGACASSEVAKYEAVNPEDIAAEVEVTPSGSAGDSYQFKGPAIDVRAGFGDFASGMLRGGSEFGSSISLQGAYSPASSISHTIVAQLQYTNLLGVYRRYDRAGIDGIDHLNVTTLDTYKQFTPNSVNMTETVGIAISEADLRSRTASGLVLRIATESGNLQELAIPASYISGYLLAVDRSIVPLPEPPTAAEPQP